MEPNNIPQTVAVINYDEFRHNVEETLWQKLKDEASKLVDHKKYYSTKEVAEIFKVTEKTIDNWNNIGKLCYSQVFGEGRRLFSIEEVNALHEELTRQRKQKYSRGY
jgi:hypothetical protein